MVSKYIVGEWKTERGRKNQVLKRMQTGIVEGSEELTDVGICLSLGDVTAWAAA